MPLKPGARPRKFLPLKATPEKRKAFVERETRKAVMELATTQSGSIFDRLVRDGVSREDAAGIIKRALLIKSKQSKAAKTQARDAQRLHGP